MTTTSATVTWWRPEDGGGVVGGGDLPGPCWVERAVVRKSRALRAGEAVEVEWEEGGPDDYPCRALRVTVRNDLQTTPGG